MNTLNSFRLLHLAAGIGYLIIFVTGIYANFFVLETLVIPDDPSGTWQQITSRSQLFRLGLVSFLIMVIFDTFLTWALYYILRPGQESLSQLAGWLRLINCALFAVALVHLFQVTGWLNSDDVAVAASAMDAIELFNTTWLVGLIFFGLHLLILGYLIWNSVRFPSWIGGLLFIAGLGYLTDSFARFLMTNYSDFQDQFTMAVVIPGVVGEMALTVWLLIRGGRVLQNNEGKSKQAVDIHAYGS